MRKITVNGNLALLLGGQFVSQIGDKFYALALAYWVLQTTGSPLKMGLMLFSSMIPSVILGFFAGGFIDRYSRKAILVSTDVLRGLTVAVVFAVFCTGSLGLAAIIAAQVLLSAASAFFNPAVYAMVPQIVREDRLVKANSMSQLLAGIANILGPVLGGLAVSLLGYAFVFAFNAVSFFASGLCEGLMRISPAQASAEKPRMRESLAEGYRYILERKRIWVILGVVAVIHFFAGSIQVVMPVLANSLAGDGARNLGYIETAFGVGIVASALALRAANLKGREELGMFGGIAAIGAVMAAIGVVAVLGVGTVPPYMAFFLLLSSAVVVISTNYTVLLQRTVDNAVAGRVFGIVGSVGNFTLPVSVLLFGCILNNGSVGIVTAACGGAILLICAGLAVIYKRQKTTTTSIVG